MQQDAQRRIKERIPPGYADAGKRDKPDKQGQAEGNEAEGSGDEKPQRKVSERAFGDIILWHQLIDKAKAGKKPIILMTDDKKEDWWLDVNGRKMGPRPELVDEMATEAGVTFYMYSSDRFLEEGQQRLRLQRQEEAIAEARRLREQEEAVNRATPRRRAVTFSDLVAGQRARVATDSIAALMGQLSGLNLGAASAAQSVLQQWQAQQDALRSTAMQGVLNILDQNYSSVGRAAEQVAEMYRRLGYDATAGLAASIEAECDDEAGSVVEEAEEAEECEDTTAEPDNYDNEGS